MSAEQLAGAVEDCRGAPPSDQSVAGLLEAALRPDRLFEAGRSLGVAALAGGLAGFLAAGAGSRLAMRASGFMFARDNPDSVSFIESGARVGEITAGGTIFLLVFGTLLGFMGAYFYATLKPWLPGSTLLRGLLFGLIALAPLSPFALERGNDDFQRLGDVRINVALFASLFLFCGLLIALLDAWVGRTLPQKLEFARPDWRASRALGSIVLIGGIALGLFMMQILVMFVLVAIVGANSQAERLQHGFALVTILTLLPISMLSQPGEQADGSQSVFQGAQKFVYGSLGLMLLLSAAATTQAVVELISA